jgi:hypothetical protein
MVIDQRNAGASYSAVDGGYSLDRWKTGSWDGSSTVTGKYTVQQDAGAVTPPAGFIDYLGVTSSAATSLASGAEYILQQLIEGYNMADLGWGTANAKTVTLSFWVRSSLTGTFGGALLNAAVNYSYPFSYSIPTANTWTQISITITGATAGTWSTTNGLGIRVYFGLGVGSSLSGTAGSWSANRYESVTGAVNVLGTNGATWYVTGVQLELGVTATDFDFRSIGTEIQLCQRYYQKIGPNIGSTSSAGYATFAAGYGSTGTSASCAVKYNVTMRTNPTISQSNTGINVPTQITATGIGFTSLGTDSAFVNVTVAGGITVYQGLLWCQNNNPAGFVDLSAEL